jgi:hypothetical protein
MQSGIEMSYSSIKSNIADSLNLVVQIDRRPGKRFVSEVLEIHGYDPKADRYSLDTLFRPSEVSPCNNVNIYSRPT